MTKKFTTERTCEETIFAVFRTLFTISVDKISVAHMVKIYVNQSKQKTELSPIVLAISLCFSNLGHKMVP